MILFCNFQYNDQSNRAVLYEIRHHIKLFRGVLLLYCEQCKIIIKSREEQYDFRLRFSIEF